MWGFKSSTARIGGCAPAMIWIYDSISLSIQNTHTQTPDSSVICPGVKCEAATKEISS